MVSSDVDRAEDVGVAVIVCVKVGDAVLSTAHAQNGSPALHSTGGIEVP